MSTMVGTSAEKERYETVNASKEGLVNNDANQQIINAATKKHVATPNKSIRSELSPFVYS